MRTERGSRFGKSRLQEAMHGMAVGIAKMAGRALGIADSGMAEGGVRSAIAKPILELGLQLLARGAWRRGVAIGAG
jgi:hypothetical protein